MPEDQIIILPDLFGGSVNKELASGQVKWYEQEGIWKSETEAGEAPVSWDWEGQVILCKSELRGSSCSHMDILVKNLGIPAIVEVGHFPENIDGKQRTADTGAGKLFIGQV